MTTQMIDCYHLSYQFALLKNDRSKSCTSLFSNTPYQICLKWWWNYSKMNSSAGFQLELPLQSRIGRWKGNQKGIDETSRSKLHVFLTTCKCKRSSWKLPIWNIFYCILYGIFELVLYFRVGFTGLTLQFLKKSYYHEPQDFNLWDLNSCSQPRKLQAVRNEVKNILNLNFKVG